MWVRQLKLSSSQKIMGLNSPVIHPKGYPDFPINGLSFYSENVELVRSRLYLQDGDRANTQAVLSFYLSPSFQPLLPDSFFISQGNSVM